MVSDAPSLQQAKVTDTHVEVELSDGRRIATPLEWYPALRGASRDELDNMEVSHWGLHWPLLDEDLSLAGMLSGTPGVKNSSDCFGGSPSTDALSVETIDLGKVGLQNSCVDFPDLKSRMDD